MKKNPGRKDARLEARSTIRQRGDLNRKSQHKMRTHDGMTKSANAKFRMDLTYGVVKI